jgi:hypothetical protein
MDRRIRFYSDDSYVGCGKQRHHVVVAGFALEYDRTNVRSALLEAERMSGKKIFDWFTTPRKAREKYLEAVLGIASIRGRIFYRPFDWAHRSESRPITARKVDHLRA